MSGPVPPADGRQEQAPQSAPPSGQVSPPASASLPPAFQPPAPSSTVYGQQSAMSGQPVPPAQPSLSVPQSYPQPAAADIEPEPDEQEPVAYALPDQVESAFVAMPEDPRLAEQRERMAVILDRAVLVLGVVGLITVGLALVQTLRGNPSIVGWLLPFVFFLLAGVAYFLLHRMEAKPPNSIEVPLELADDLTDAIAAREELETRGAETLNDDDYLSTLADVDELLEAAGKSAGDALKAERAADLGTAARAHAETRTRVDDILDIRDDVLEEDLDEDWEDEDDEYYEDDAEYYEDEVVQEPEQTRPAVATAGWEATEVPADEGQGQAPPISVPASPYARPAVPNQPAPVNYADEPPPVIRSEIETDGSPRRSSRPARPTSAPSERAGRAAPYRPNNEDS